ncbi:hypothetical protein BB560_002213 [Smittium megazygosporum]|uniref:Trafficking protein particle complex subunit n=1 Tax=Smittium megazygosporum TaxID=133381 RepID=A0A2T9ZFE5_9FUNG|nr:hypothetical protein BB560_002213 [Smittium megazygosporum]
MIYSMYIVNKAGSLVYNKSFNEGLAQLNSNEALILAGTLHSILAITDRVTPENCVKEHKPGGVELIEAEGLLIHCFQTPTGLMFVLICDNQLFQSEPMMYKIYQIYSDYVLKNPFHTPDMPIRSEMFDTQLRNLIRSV